MVHQLGQPVQRRAAFVLWLHTYVGTIVFQQVIGDKRGRQIAQHLRSYRFAGDALLQFSKGLDTSDGSTRLAGPARPLTPDNNLTVHHRAVR